MMICHADSKDDALVVEDMLKKKVADAETYICPIGPIIGASIGPDAIAVFSFGADTSRFDLQ